MSGSNYNEDWISRAARKLYPDMNHAEDDKGPSTSECNPRRDTIRRLRRKMGEVDNEVKRLTRENERIRNQTDQLEDQARSSLRSIVVSTALGGIINSAITSIAQGAYRAAAQLLSGASSRSDAVSFSGAIGDINQMIRNNDEQRRLMSEIDELIARSQQYHNDISAKLAYADDLGCPTAGW